MEIIKSVEIINFRSIIKLETPLQPNHLNIIVGKNDIGKSNFLKALNLFFNGQTEIGVPFRFQDDFCKHAKVPNKKAPEVVIKIEFVIPHRFKDHEPLIWTKVWRREGQYADFLLTKSGNTPSAKGGGMQWVQKILYKYIPAIRGEGYFNNLMGELHDALSEVDPKVFTTVSNQFIAGLKKQVDELVNDIINQLGFKSKIGMPSNFRQLFATLDFSLDHSGVAISLNKKGDGIKAQHIPVILKFIANHYKSVAGHAVIPPDTIWGFEEPENNMEMGNAFKLALIFKTFSNDLQIFINTHSPAFYSLAKNGEIDTNLFLVKENNGTQFNQMEVDQMKVFDVEMGVLPVISDYVEKEVKKRQALEAKLKNSYTLKSATKYLVLTEDKDTSFVEKLFEMQGFGRKITEVVSYDGRSNLLAAMQSCKIKLTEKPHLTDIIFHRDRDVWDGDEPDKDAVQKRLDGLNASSAIRHHLFLTDGYDAEAYFLNPSHIHELYSGISKEQAAEYINNATEQAENKSIDKLLEKTKFKQDGFVKSGKPVHEFSITQTMKDLKNLYRSDIPRYRYGKTVYGLLISILEKGRGRMNLLQPTKHIVIPQLKSILSGKVPK